MNDSILTDQYHKLSKEDFRALLRDATEWARNFALDYVRNDLPAENIYWMELSVSRDSPELTQFDIYPEDEGRIIEQASADMVVETLFRKGKVPVWIDISVHRVEKGKTVFHLLCAGRYSDNINEFYYRRNGSGPFGIKSPSFPPDYQKGEKFWLPEPKKWSFRDLFRSNKRQ